MDGIHQTCSCTPPAHLSGADGKLGPTFVCRICDDSNTACGCTLTIRRKDEFWAGNFTDLTIHQVIMRMLKASGGLAHDRGVTDNTQTK